MRSAVDDALRDLARVLDALELTWFLFGAQAAIVYGSTRVTEDIDVTVNLGSRTARELVARLKRSGFRLRVGDTAGFVERTRVLPIVHLRTAMPVDIVLAGPGLEDLFASRIRRHEREGISIPVASPEDLVVMKILAGRPRDIEDVRSVLQAMGRALDVPLIEETLTLLEQALAQDDLLPLLARLRREAARRTKAKSPSPRVAPKAKPPATKRTRRP